MPRKLLSEVLGTALLLAVVIGSGIMAERLAGGNVGHRAARQHAGDRRRPVHPDRGVRARQRRAFQSGRRARDGAARRAAARRRSVPYIVAQLLGADAGRLAGARDVRPAPSCSSRPRCAAGTGQWIAEGVATFGPAAGDPARAGGARRRRWSPPTSARPTGSPPRPRSPTRPPPSAACSATASPASRRRASPGFVVAELVGAGLGRRRAPCALPAAPASRVPIAPTSTSRRGSRRPVHRLECHDRHHDLSTTRPAEPRATRWR